MMAASLGCASFGFFVLVVTHVWVWRRRPSSAPRMLELSGLAALGGAAGIFARSAAGGDLLGLAVVSWIYFFIAVFYFFIYAGIARAVSVTFLARLHLAPAGRLELDALIREYLGSARFEDRLDQMEAMGLLRQEDRVRLTPRGRTAASALKTLSRALAASLEG